MQAGTVDVDIRTLDLPSMMLTAADREPDPMLPAVRRAAPDSTSDVIAPSIAEYTTPPLYSEQAQRARVEGVVTIGVHVDGGGRLLRSHVVRGLGFGLDQNALVALRQWQFRPGTRHGRPEAMEAEIDIEFNLASEAVNALIANDMATLVGPGVTPPRVVRTAAARVPRVHARGSVVLDVVLLEDGTPKVIRILQALTPEADERAVRHFGQWRFTPAMKGGVPVKVRMNAEVRFYG
jgi:TonB family protein